MGGIMDDLIKIVQKFKDKKIIVLGDVMLDKYIWGNVSRISPEAPVQVVEVDKESYAPGGAANVASNISALGAKSFLVGVLGKDHTKEQLVSELVKKNIDVSGLIEDINKRTIRKVRVFGKNQQLLRFDYEKKGYVSPDTEKKILEYVSLQINSTDALVISDYAKGVITKRLMDNLIALCSKHNKIIVVDPKPKHKDFYKNVTLLAPNHKEAHEMTRLGEEEDENKDMESIGNKLVQDLNSTVLITRGEKGMSLFEKDGKITNIPTFAKEVYDIVGAGDTSVATLALALSSGASFKNAAVIANHAAGITVGKVGTSTVTIDELQQSIENG
jgi:D-glycero-beta-D-manno-heptose-7-phosphate kinase